MNRVGIIDIGPNSLRLMLTEINDNGYFKIIDELKTQIRLCHDLVNECSICAESINTILSTLRAYKSLCEVSGATEIMVVATETLREAKNKDLLLPLLKDELDLHIKHLDHNDEIYYNYLGITRSMHIKNSLMVEVAGTDTHLAWIKDNTILKSTTLPFGSVNLSYNFHLNNRVISDNLFEAISYIKSFINDIEWLKEGDFESVIAIAAAARNIGKIDRAKKRYPFDIPHNYELTDLDVQDIFNLVKCKNLKQRELIDGIDPEQADIIVGGTIALNEITKFVNCSKVVISGRGLREGLLYEYLKNNYTIEEDILDYSLNAILDTLNSDKNHAKHVFNITSKLFNDLRPLHHLDSEFMNVIKTACMLHDIGISINYYSHHKHSFYVIMNSYISGLTHKELLLSAAITASHRFNNYETPIIPFSAIINQLDFKSVRFIGALIKIAEGLDRSLVGAVKNLDVDFNEDEVIIKVYSDINVDFEIRQALRSKEYFKDIYRKDLIIIKG